jgi:hypothetical protein
MLSYLQAELCANQRTFDLVFEPIGRTIAQFVLDGVGETSGKRPQRSAAQNYWDDCWQPALKLPVSLRLSRCWRR